MGAATRERSLGGDILQFHRRTMALKLQNDSKLMETSSENPINLKVSGLSMNIS